MLLTPGFLSHQVEVAGVQMAVRTLFPGEMFVLRNRLGTQVSMRAWREWQISSAIWMINGQVLFEDVNAPVHVRQSLASLPQSAIDKLYSVHTALQNRVQRALTQVEAYCYEDFGRAAWRMVGCQSPAREEVAGIPGVSALGMNLVQRLWVAFNIAEDERQTWNLEWAAAKLIASASAPKGVKRLYQKDESDRNLEESRRKAVIQKAYYDATGKHSGEDNGMIVYRAVSPEELADEMERQVRGERDSHDQIIDMYKMKIREKHERDRAAHEARMQEIARLQEEAAEAGASPLVGYTLEQLRELQGAGVSLQRRGSVVTSSSGADRLYNKFVAQDIKIGGLTDGGKSLPIPTDRSETENLGSAVSNRQVRLTDDGGRS